MTTPNLQDRMGASGVRLPEDDMTAFAAIVADTDRIAAWIRTVDLIYSDEPAICFRAPQG